MTSATTAIMTSAATPSDNGAWIRRFHPAEQARTRLICFPHAGGSASFYFPVSRQLSPEVDAIAIQYPGRQDRRREPCIDSLTVLADMVVPQLLPWLDRPVTLFGHSMGATLAFEVARRLRDLGITPLGLFASGRCAPHRQRDERMHLADDDGLIADLGRLSGTNTQVLGDEEILRSILPALRSDYHAAETYRYQPGPKLDCPITALIGDVDEQVTTAEASAWGEHTTGGFDLRVFSGGHFYLNDHADAVIAALAEHITAATAVGSPAAG